MADICPDCWREHSGKCDTRSAEDRKAADLCEKAADIARKLQLPVAEVLGRLTALELDGAVRRHGAGYIRALRRGKERA